MLQDYTNIFILLHIEIRKKPTTSEVVWDRFVGTYRKRLNCVLKELLVGNNLQLRKMNDQLTNEVIDDKSLVEIFLQINAKIDNFTHSVRFD